MGYYKNINEENTKYYNADMSSAKDWDMASDCTLYAKWAVRPPAFTVSFDTQGGGSVSSQQVTDGDYAAKPFTDPTKSGYAFGGWYTDSACSADNRWNFNACPIIRDTTLYAKWTAEPVPTPSPSASEAPAPSPSVAAAPGSLGSIIPKTVERNKETGMTTIAIDVSDLPEGTTAIETPGGEVLYVSDAKDGVLIFEVNEDDVDANGEIEIVALDGEMTPIAKVRVRVPEENETPVIANTGEPDEPGVNIWLIVAIILAGLIVLGGIASIIIWRRKQQAQR